MANNFLSNGLLGMGGIGGVGGAQPAYSSLLGDLYDPKEARKAQIKQMLLGMGMGLMSEKGFGRGAELALAMGSRAGDDYRQSALDAYRLKQAEEERQYGRARDAKEDERWEMDYGLRQKDAAWQSTERQRQLDEWDLADTTRQGQQNQVQGWMGQQEQAGVNLLPQNIRTMARQGGVQGMVSPQTEQLYNRMQPLVGAGMYPEAFQQMTAEPGKADLVNVGKGSRLYDPSTGQWIEPPSGPGAADANFDDEAKLRAEYMKETQPFADLRTNYQRIVAATQDQTGASDIALVFSFMKMLDPTSAVREGEYATAETAGGVPAEIVSLYNRALTGQRLSPQVRTDFQQQAGRQYEQQMQTYAGIRKKYEDLSRAYRFDPSRIAPDLSYGVKLLPNQQTTANIPQEAISELLADPSPQAIQEFDAAFGQGAAAAVLNRR